MAEPARAHHGWSWTEDENTTLTGVITDARLGNPHGRLTVDVAGQAWRVEVGQPWRNTQAGLTEALLAPGRMITVIGQRSADPEELRLKAERLRIDDQDYVLYPERD
ncbi:MAG: hypothetical protein KDJ28_10140 [Candidatus Competibacteraceae bacterium]|nr:hypothetical protein [Candidatus Competibacteraceae bacterium]